MVFKGSFQEIELNDTSLAIRGNNEKSVSKYLRATGVVRDTEIFYKHISSIIIWEGTSRWWFFLWLVFRIETQSFVPYIKISTLANDSSDQDLCTVSFKKSKLDEALLLKKEIERRINEIDSGGNS
jgi:hypothetical protein